MRRGRSPDRSWGADATSRPRAGEARSRAPRRTCDRAARAGATPRLRPRGRRPASPAALASLFTYVHLRVRERVASGCARDRRVTRAGAPTRPTRPSPPSTREAPRAPAPRPAARERRAPNHASKSAASTATVVRATTGVRGTSRAIPRAPAPRSAVRTIRRPRTVPIRRRRPASTGASAASPMAVTSSVAAPAADRAEECSVRHLRTPSRAPRRTRDGRRRGDARRTVVPSRALIPYPVAAARRRLLLPDRLLPDDREVILGRPSAVARRPRARLARGFAHGRACVAESTNETSRFLLLARCRCSHRGGVLLGG